MVHMIFMMAAISAGNMILIFKKSSTGNRMSNTTMIHKDVIGWLVIKVNAMNLDMTQVKYHFPLHLIQVNGIMT